MNYDEEKLFFFLLYFTDIKFTKKNCKQLKFVVAVKKKKKRRKKLVG